MNYLPEMVGTIERRLLVNYRVDPKVLNRTLPEPFRPQLVAGAGMAGICLIRLGGLRPVGLPRSVGVRTENAAHRIAVEWDGSQGVRRGVYIPRRDTSSRLTAAIGGRLFPGEHHTANFEVSERCGRYAVAFTSFDRSAHVDVLAHAVAHLPSGSIFASLQEASEFFKEGSLGYSATHTPGRYQGIELGCEVWRMAPMEVEHVESSFFGDSRIFPEGSVELDSALLMNDLPARWQARGELSSSRPESFSENFLPSCRNRRSATSLG